MPGNAIEAVKDWLAGFPRTPDPLKEGISPKLREEAVQTVMGLGGALRPITGTLRWGTPLTTVRDLLQMRAPKFVRAMEGKTDVGVRTWDPSELRGPRRFWRGELQTPMVARGEPLDATVAGKMNPLVALNPFLSPRDASTVLAHELFHHWFRTIPQVSQVKVAERALKALPKAEKWLERTLNADSYPFPAEEIAVRRLVQKILPHDETAISALSQILK